MASHAPGGAYWYLERENLPNERTYKELRRTLERETQEAKHRRGTRGEKADSWHYPDALSH